MLCAAAAGVRVGYCLAAEPAAREALDADDPIDGEKILSPGRQIPQWMTQHSEDLKR